MDDILVDEDESTFTILSIDPGTTTLGFAIIKVDILTDKIVEAFAWTVDATRLAFYLDETVNLHGDKFARIISHKRNFENVLRFYKPLVVAAETPFFNRRRPSAGGPLFEFFSTLEQTVFEWDRYKPIYKFEPRTVKLKVGATAGAKKHEVKAALEDIDELKDVSMSFLDEHAIDALAVGYTYLQQLRKSRKEKK